MKKKYRRVMIISSSIMISIIGNLLTPNHSTMDVILFSFWNNSSLIIFSLCAIVCISLIIKWIIDDYKERQRLLMATINRIQQQFAYYQIALRVNQVDISQRGIIEKIKFFEKMNKSIVTEDEKKFISQFNAEIIIQN